MERRYAVKIMPRAIKIGKITFPWKPLKFEHLQASKLAKGKCKKKSVKLFFDRFIHLFMLFF